MTKDRRFASNDGRFAVLIRVAAIEELQRRYHSALPRETGGILVGRYLAGGSVAEVVVAMGPTPDATGLWERFVRGVSGLADALKMWWEEPARSFYIGEWHTHPNAAPLPSPEDDKSMLETSVDKATNCPEPILIIVGKDERLGVFVYPRGRTRIELRLGSDEHAFNAP